MAGPDFSKALQPKRGPDFSKATQPAGGGVMGTVADVARSIPSGVRAGLEGLAGIGGDVYNLEVSAAEKLAQWLGASPETVAEIKAARGQNWLPTSQDVAETVTNPVIGEAYEPTSRMGKVAHTLGSFLPGAGRSISRTVVGPTAGTEIGGEIGEAYGDEGLGRLLGGLSGAVAPGAMSRMVAGRRLEGPSRQHVQTLTDEGVDLTGGQATGQKWLQAIETGPFEGKAAALAERQGEQFSRAALGRAGVNADRASPDVLRNAFDEIGNEYDALIANSGGVPLDTPLQNELLGTVVDYQQLKGVAAAPLIETYFTRITDAAQANGGIVPADVFQTIRSDIARNLRTTKDPEIIQTLRSMQDSLFDSIGRNGSPEIVEAWRDVNNRYRNLKIIEKSMGGAGSETAQGFVTPGKLRTAVEAGDRGGYVRGRGDYADLARAGADKMTPLPQSGTTPRALPYVIGGTAGAAAQRALEGDLKGAGLLAAGAVAPALASKLLTSRPVRTSLVRQAVDPLPMLDPMTAALLMRQLEQGR
jgi:hypothetical protein